MVYFTILALNDFGGYISLPYKPPEFLRYYEPLSKDEKKNSIEKVTKKYILRQILKRRLVVIPNSINHKIDISTLIC